MPDLSWWQARGRDALLAVLNEEHAVTWTEAQARISDRAHHAIGRPVQPHILTLSRNTLVEDGRITVTSEPTRGGSAIVVLQPADTTKRLTKINRAAARKRLLTATFNSWATSSVRYPQGLVGTAGERVIGRSITEAAPYGLRFAAPSGGGEVNFLLGDVVEGGALDAALWADESDENGRIINSTLCPVEVKNIRHWIYPRHWEVFQLLDKAARLSQRVNSPICPVLITRRKSIWANDMSRALGFRILDVSHQFVLPTTDVDEQTFLAVRDELGYHDLIRTEDAHSSVVDLLRKSLIRSAAPNAQRWQDVGSKLGSFYTELRNRDLDNDSRDSLLYDLGAELLELDPEAEARWARHFGNDDEYQHFEE